MPTIVEYRDQEQPVNEYPARIVSPPRPSACCARTMETLGRGQIEGLWRYVYRRCPTCGYTVRNFYAVSWLALEEQWRRECPDLAHWRVRLKRKRALLAEGQPVPGPRPASRFNGSMRPRRNGVGRPASGGARAAQSRQRPIQPQAA
ncbi:MAG TPA: hypothetical protein VIG69_04105 [Candidatus Methylomirabilis sp.]|jgi:hypothetical protein